MQDPAFIAAFALWLIVLLHEEAKQHRGLRASFFLLHRVTQARHGEAGLALHEEE